MHTSRPVSRRTLTGITGNDTLALTPRRRSYRNVIHTRMGALLRRVQVHSVEREHGPAWCETCPPSSFDLLMILLAYCANGPSRPAQWSSHSSSFRPLLSHLIRLRLTSSRARCVWVGADGTNGIPVDEVLGFLLQNFLLKNLNPSSFSFTSSRRLALSTQQG